MSEMVQRGKFYQGYICHSAIGFSWTTNEAALKGNKEGNSLF